MRRSRRKRRRQSCGVESTYPAASPRNLCLPARSSAPDHYIEQLISWPQHIGDLILP